MDPKKQVDAAAVKDGDRIRGYRVVRPDGSMYLARPDQIRLTASVERGVEIEGLKEGYRLGTAEDEAKLAAENRKRDEERERARKAADQAAQVAEAAVAQAAKALAKAEK